MAARRQTLTGKLARRLIRQASEGYEVVERRAPVGVKLSNPRLYDERTDFDAVKAVKGVYIIYCSERRRTPKTKETRILYIGRGWIGNRLFYHHTKKRGLGRFAEQHTVKYAFIPIPKSESDWAFVMEGILINEHIRLFGCKPYYNGNAGSSTLLGWHHVMTLKPGPRAILSKYGGR
ncbi:hypothetical protein JXD38_03205 [candidate division WOR-3 bacterium]|nr:hypothetical protein [candidate division WOR-3 bacterium]